MLKKKFDFVGNIKKYIIISVAVILVGLIASVIFGPVIDIQFKGGTKLSFSYTGEIKHDAAEKALKADLSKLAFSFTGDANEKKVKEAVKDAFGDKAALSIEGQTLTVTVKSVVSDEQLSDAEKALKSALPSNNVANIADENVFYKKDMLGNNFAVTGSSDFAGNSKSIVISLSDNVSAKTADATAAALQAAFPKNNVKSNETVSVEASVGIRFFIKALVAVVIASVLVVIYVGLRFRRIGGVSAGVTALIALVHDILIAFAVCVIFRLPIDANFIAVVLTLLGYSLNDTIIIYDRIRENRRMYGTKLTLAEMVNKSNNETLSRTILTTITTLSAVIVVIVVSEVMGLTSLRSFSIPLAAGLISGSYSSICLSPCLWVKWKEYADKKQAAKPRNKKKKKA